ncbi:hypothetical protein [Pasteurella multocida]|uniref:hypothetical protein n=1 Tax=Pasteurella multocida TaxID=747 RepID=UPI003AFF93B9
MSDKVEKLGKELELTPEQWADFHKFYMSYWEQYGGKFMFRNAECAHAALRSKR